MTLREFLYNDGKLRRVGKFSYEHIVFDLGVRQVFNEIVMVIFVPKEASRNGHVERLKHNRKVNDL